MAGVGRWNRGACGAGHKDGNNDGTAAGFSGRWQRWRRPLLASAALIPLLGLVSCGAQASLSLPAAPGGTYTSTQYHFSITYPAGWLATVPPEPSPMPGSSATIPLTLVITRSSGTQSAADLLSNVTLAVVDASNPGIAASIATLEKDPKEQHITLAGLPAYADAASTQPVLNSNVSDTHAAYYVVANGFEYEITTDALSSDGNAASAIAQMLHSFTVTK